MPSFCTSCGSPIPDGNAFCTSCGTPVNEDVKSSEAALGGEGAAFDSFAMPADPTMTMPASQIEQPVAPPPTSSSPTVANAPGMPMSTPPVMQSSPTYTAPTASSAASKHKPWIVVGIAAVAVIIAAIAVIVSVERSDNPNSDPVVINGASGASAAAANFTITYNTNGGSSIESSKVESGYSLSEPAAPTRSGYTFGGWYLDSGYTQKVVFPYSVTGNITLYAKWDAETPSPSPTPTSKTLTVVGKNGDTRTAEIHLSGTSGRVFPDSNSRELTQYEINQLSDAEKCIAWNEIIAASNGYSFKNSGLRAYFSSCSWYHENPGASAGGNLSAAASANVNNLKAACDSWWQNLATY